ncbi:MAG: SIS domain-containing protein [Nanoarchaeota archaeon]
MLNGKRNNIENFLIKSVYNQIRDKLEKNYDFLEYNKIIISGMGASGIIGNLIQDYFKWLSNKDERFKDKIVVVNKSYYLPSFINEEWLSICISFSGKTEETLSVLKQSIEKNINTVFISSNEGIKNLYSRDNYFSVVIPKTELPPRYNLASLLAGTLLLFFEKEKVDEIFNFNEIKLNNNFEKLINELKEKIPVVYISEELKSVSERIAQQFNENSKIHCIYGYFSEANHNQLEVQKNDNFIYFFLRHPFEHERIKKRFEIVKELYEKECFNFYEIKANENDLLKNALTILNLFDYLTIKLGIEKNVPFNKNPLISFLKERLKDK